MTEQERRVIVERVNKSLNTLEMKVARLKRVSELEQDAKVSEYLKLLDELKILNYQIQYMDTKEEIIRTEFYGLFGDGKNVNPEKEQLECNHEIWIYIGSCCICKEPNVYEKYVEDEYEKEFKYNKYVCLECGKVVEEKDWQKFEKENYVLKNRDDLSANKFREMYFKLLLNHTVKEAQAIVVKNFHENSTTCKLLKLTKQNNAAMQNVNANYDVNTEKDM